ncbi:ttc30a, partial [Symbiodinium sp. CCMP2456]
MGLLSRTIRMPAITWLLAAQPYTLSQAFELPPIEGHKDWCWSFPFASAEACCFRAEATSVQVQGRCWPEALIGVAFLLCCLSVEHAATVKARELLSDRWSIPGRGLLSPPALLEDLAGGFGPLHSAYHAKDAGVLLQLVMALPVVWAHLGATARLALEILKWLDDAEASVASSSGPGRWNQSFEVPASAHPWRVEPGWEVLMVELQPPPHQLPLAGIPISSEDLTSLESKLWDPPLSIASLLQRHVSRVQQLVRGSYEPLKAVWELSRELTLLSQSLVLFLTTLDLRRSLNLPGPQFRLADVPVHSGCCERYRILSGLLERLRQDLGKTKLVYVEVGVADGSTALFLLRLPWLQAYLVENQPKERLLSALRPVQDRAHLLPMDSVEAAAKFREAGLVADAVFLDGDHSATGIRRDLAAWVPLLGDGGLLAGHDFSWEHPGILETIFLERAGSELYLAPDHVFYWFQRSNQSDVHTRKRRLAVLEVQLHVQGRIQTQCRKLLDLTCENAGAPQSQGHTPCTLVSASEIIAIDGAGRWMPGSRRRRGPKGPVPNKESALSTAADGESEHIRGPLAPSVAVAAFRGAVAMDVKTGGAPLLIEVSSHLESITKVLFSQDSLEKTNLAEALWPILEGSGWEEERIERFCSTCWEAARKAGLRRATQDRPEPTSRNPHQVLQRALSILAETHAQELVQEEEEQLSRSARRAAKAGRAFEPEVVAEDADDAASQYAPSSVSSDDLRVHDRSNPFSALQDFKEGEEEAPSTGSLPAKPRLKDRCKWTVKSYKNGTETTWDVLESDGHLRSMRIVGKEPVLPAQAECPRRKGGSDSKEEREKSVTLSYSETAEEEQSISIIRTVSSGTAARLWDELEDERRRGDGNEGLEGLDEGSTSERSTVSEAEAAPGVGVQQAASGISQTNPPREQEVPGTMESDSRPSCMWSGPPSVPPPLPKRSSPLAPIGTAVADAPDESSMWRPQTFESPLVQRAVTSGCSVYRTPSLPSRLEPASPGPSVLTSPGIGEALPYSMGRRRVGSHDVSSSSLFTRQMSIESYSTEREPSSSATPAALFPSTPDFCPSPAGSFMLPPLQPVPPASYPVGLRNPLPAPALRAEVSPLCPGAGMMRVQVKEGEMTKTIYTHIMEQKYDKAVKILNQQLQFFPESRCALSLLGYCYYHMQDFASAADIYGQLVQVVPEIDEYKIYHVQSLIKAGLYEEASQACTSVESPEYTERVLMLQATISYEQEETQLARSILDQCHPDSEERQVFEGALLWKEKRYAEAMKLFNDAITSTGYQASLAYNIALCYYSSKQYGPALKHIAEIIERGVRDHPELSVGALSEGDLKAR